MRPRFGERCDDLEKLNGGGGVAVGEQQRDGVGFGGTEVDEVEVFAIGGRGELRKLVEGCLLAAPVVVVAPVVGQTP
jgi:hypothetical protein